MTTAIAATKPANGQRVPEELAKFVGLIFEPTDRITLRPIETWNNDDGKKQSRVAYKAIRFPTARNLALNGSWWHDVLADAARERANVFYGVCPRFGENGAYELAWQIRTVRVLWADLDHCTPDEARERCRVAGIPAPSIVIASGNGVHLYWILTEPFLIDDAGDPPAVLTEFIEQGEGKKKKPVKYLMVDGKRVEETDFPKLSPKAKHVQAVVAGIATKIGGDHTIDLSRLLRLPCTMNRKDERNNKAPVECRLVECDADRRYGFAEFEPFAEVASTQETTKANPVRGRRPKNLEDHVQACGSAKDRSKADFALCCWCIRNEIEKEEAWTRVKDIGKFAQRGREYFDDTWDKAGTKVAEDGTDDRPEIEITADEHHVNESALAALARDDRVYQRVSLVRIVRTEAKEGGQILRAAGAPQIRAMSGALVREYLAANARFVSRSKDGELERKHPPSFTVEALVSRGEWPGIRPLEGVVDYPVLRPDGTILDKAGYDAQTGLIYEPLIELPELPSQPSAAAVTQAREDLLDLVTDFPFAKEPHRSTFVSAVLTVLGRNAFSGPSPLNLADANAAGSGKGLLVNVVSIATTGREVSIMSNADDDNEARKRITALAIGGDRIVNIDNISGSLGSAALDAALTSTVWRDRILGRSEMVEMPLMPVWFATGNNVVLVGDTSRRVAHMRLESRCEKPEEREGFKYPNLLEHVRHHRARYLAAGLTILRGYCAAGRPDQHLKAWGSFEGWTALVRSAVVWCGLPDPGETRTELRERSDQEGRALRAIFAGIQFFDPSRSGIAVSEIVEQVHNPTYRDSPLCVALREALMMVCTSRGKDFPSAKSIGMKLHHLQGRIVAGQCLTRGERNHTSVWSVAETQEAGD